MYHFIDNFRTFYADEIICILKFLQFFRKLSFLFSWNCISFSLRVKVKNQENIFLEFELTLFLTVTTSYFKFLIGKEAARITYL